MSNILVSINSDDVSLGPQDQVTIANAGLLNALVQSQDKTVQLLSTGVSPVKLEDISVDPEGRVVIANAAFAKTLRGNLSSQLGGGSGNGVCGNVSCAME